MQASSSQYVLNACRKLSGHCRPRVETFVLAQARGPFVRVKPCHLARKSYMTDGRRRILLLSTVRREEALPFTFPSTRGDDAVGAERFSSPSSPSLPYRPRPTPLGGRTGPGAGPARSWCTKLDRNTFKLRSTGLRGPALFCSHNPSTIIGCNCAYPSERLCTVMAYKSCEVSSLTIRRSSPFPSKISSITPEIFFIRRFPVRSPGEHTGNLRIKNNPIPSINTNNSTWARRLLKKNSFQALFSVPRNLPYAHPIMLILHGALLQTLLRFRKVI